MMAKWSLAFACAIIYMFSYASLRLSSVYYVECMTRFDITRQEASIPFTLTLVLKYISGPIVGIFGQRFGLKETTIIGCFLAVIGIGACFFAENIIQVILFWGIIFGLGCGFSSNLLSAILNEYYENDKTTANGLALAGGSIGNMTFPLLVLFIIDYYGTSGSFLILSAIGFNMIPAAMLLENPTTSKRNVTLNCNESTRLKLSDSSSKFKNGLLEPNVKNKSKAVTHPGFVNKSLDLSSEYKSDQIDNQTSPKSDLFPSKQIVNIENCLFQSETKTERNISFIRNEAEKKNSNLQTLKIFLNPVFIFISLTQSMYIFGRGVLLTIILDYMGDKGIAEERRVYFLTCIGASDLIGRMFLGFVTDKAYMTPTNYTAMCFVLKSVCYFMLIVLRRFEYLMISIFCWGLTSGGLSSVLPRNISEFIPDQHKTMAMSCRMIFAGPLSITTPFLIDYFRGTVGSYDSIIGILSAFSIISTALTWLAQYWATKKQLNKCTETDN